MSLFGSSLLGDFEDDPIFGSHMQHMQRMNNMMHSMFADPFGMMNHGMSQALMDPRQMQNRQGGMPGMQMMPFGFPPMPSPMNMGGLFGNLQNMGQNPNCHSFSSSSVMTMTSGPDGRPQVYQESMSTRVAPGGVKETKKTVSDSRTGKKSLAIGHHIGDRAHILEREQNIYSREQEERQEFINLEEEEAEEFNREWQSKTRRNMNAIGGPSHRSQYRPQEHRQLALPSTAPSSSNRQPSSSNNRRNHSTATTAAGSSSNRAIAIPRRSLRPATGGATTKFNNATISTERSTIEPTATATSASHHHHHQTSSNNTRQRRPSVEIEEITPLTSNNDDNNDDNAVLDPDVPQNLTTTNRSRKREHSPEPEIICDGISTSKRLSTSPKRNVNNQQ